MDRYLLFEDNQIRIEVFDKRFEYALELPDLINDPEINKYTRHGAYPFTMENVEEYDYQSDSRITWAVFLKLKGINSVNDSTEDYIGNITLQDIDFFNRKAEIGILLSKESWGRGIATKIVKRIIKHGFHKFNLNKIYLGTSITNIGMQKVAIKSSMKLEATLDQELNVNGKLVAKSIYSILKESHV